MCPGKPICSPPHFSEVSPVLPLKHFQCWTDWWWLFLVLSVKVVKCFLFLCLSPLDVPWCEVLCFVPADNVSSSSKLQIFKDASHLWRPLAVSASLSARSFRWTPACPGLYIHRSFRRWLSNIETCHAGLLMLLFTSRLILLLLFLLQAHWIPEDDGGMCFVTSQLDDGGTCTWHCSSETSWYQLRHSRGVKRQPTSALYEKSHTKPVNGDTSACEWDWITTSSASALDDNEIATTQLPLLHTTNFSRERAFCLYTKW